MKDREYSELGKLRNELGALGGAGHFWGDEKAISSGGIRDQMGKGALRNVIRLLLLGEKKVNLKEREFIALFSDKTRINS